VPYHAGVVGQDALDLLLGGDAGVETHREVVARLVAHLMDRRRLGQREHAPVRDAADHAALLEDDVSCCQDDSAGESALVSKVCKRIVL
jgi:hypothetical protein